MNYKELDFTLNSSEDYQRDLLIDSLSGIGFETFEETDRGFKAYIQDSEFNQESLDEVIAEYQEMFSLSYEAKLIPHENWNEVWESNFQPLIIADQCYVRATFHKPQPEFPIEIIIDPKMAFGTGHHQTTSMMMQLMLEEDFKDKKVLDMGCGTGILAILAQKRGAKEILAIDYDVLCFDSTLENRKLNDTSEIKVLCGSKEVIPDEKFDIVLANINRNILLDQLERYAEVLSENGYLFLSGFYDGIDLEMIRKKAESLNLKYITHKKDKEWVAAKFQFI
ncbi:50S ribosomal protein L11 methyltransferase [Daejeonella oryzae]|uniref:50S ribosomal protein L11 methyltransferase n=1 Tax=Daejeonella oryzae TaxID=1122943 RepID=UPI0003FD84BC|nr:50S ribosomal protein L11 methyltransferase [Daejeonella oryzae]